jgi:hypothetical protein
MVKFDTQYIVSVAIALGVVFVLKSTDMNVALKHFILPLLCAWIGIYVITRLSKQSDGTESQFKTDGMMTFVYNGMKQSIGQLSNPVIYSIFLFIASSIILVMYGIYKN